MLPVRLFADSRFAIVITAALALGFGGNGAFLLLNLYLQQARGHSAFTTGLLTLPLTLAAIPGAKLAGSLTAEHGPRRAMVAGFALTGAALLAMIAIGADTAYLPIALLFALAGCGQDWRSRQPRLARRAENAHNLPVRRDLGFEGCDGSLRYRQACRIRVMLLAAAE